MSIFKKIFIYSYITICVITAFFTVSICYYQRKIGEEYTVSIGSDLVINSLIPVTAEYNGKVLKDCNEFKNAGEKITVDLKLFGVFPVKKADVNVVPETYVSVLGTPFGIKMYTDGVLVSDISSIKTSTGDASPAKIAGIKKGDYILRVDGVKVSSNEELAEKIEDSNGKQLKLIIKRNGKNITVKLTPVLSCDDNLYRAGIWVKDSSAGIGTLTFYSPQCDIVCGLGHAVYDKDTKEIIDFSNGEMVTADIISVRKGVQGVPGELNGKIGYNKIAKMQANCINGVFGELSCKIDLQNLTEIAISDEIRNGKANILCTLDGNGPKLYECEIKVKNVKVNNTTQNMIITITDPNLISKTGGIVQGMSGSPILQNGKLVGAVTHVLIDDPTKGYGIFAENMLETAQQVGEEQQIKDAS